MKKAAFLALAGIIVLSTVIFAVIHLKNDTVYEGNAITIILGKNEVTVPLSELEAEEFSGTLINGKGEESEHYYTGIELKTLIEQNGFDLSEAESFTVIAQDQYSAEYTIDEVLEDGKVYIAVKEDGEPLPGLQYGTYGAQIVVFGDHDLKRCVSYLESITIFNEE